VIVATTRAAADGPIRELCARMGVRCHGGDPNDLLDRHYRAALECAADVVVKIPSDCPLIDPRVIDRVLARVVGEAGCHDFVSNLHPPSYPDGQDVEAMTMATLETAWREARRPFEREHTTPFLWERPERFRIANVAWETGLDYSMSHRWTIDYPEDYRFLTAVYDELYSSDNPTFGIGEVLALLDGRPDIMAMNGHLAGVNWYRHHLDELATIQPSMTRSA
jgi:spore coat polysaccharide biosynthesis protein SpsF